MARSLFNTKIDRLRVITLFERVRTCVECKKKYEKPKDWSWSLWNKRKYCSRGCESLAKSGSRSLNWKGGTTPQRQKDVKKWLIKAKEIRERDGHRCKRCGGGGNGATKLVVHHIKTWAEFPELRFIDLNLITLCSKCHVLVHREMKACNKNGTINL